MSPVAAHGQRSARSPQSRALVALAGLASLAAAACDSKFAPGSRCRSDLQCPTNYLCMVDTCLPRGAAGTVAVEILPRSDSPAARTGIANVALGPGQITLAADNRVVVDGTVTNAPNAHVILLASNPIPGQADLQFETDVVAMKFQVAVGSRLIGSMATIWLIPNVESQQQPPVAFRTMLDSTLNFTFPPQSEMTTIRGTLHDALNLPGVPFLARAFVDGRVVSNVAPTNVFGAYELLIAPGVLPTDHDPMVSIEFTPVVADSGPRFRTSPFLLSEANSTPPRVFKLPASPTPARMRFRVQSADRGGAAVSDVTLRFRTEIPAEPDGVAIYEREVRTNHMGDADATLIPGTVAAPRKYQVTLVPSPDSPYATKCVPQHAVTTIVASNAPPQLSQTFVVEPKVTLQGTVLASDMSPVPTVNITATQLVTVQPGCANALSTSPVSSTTTRTGVYQLLLDPGMYRLDVDPPMGSPVPRLTREGDLAVAVSGNPLTTHDIRLPAGEVVEGVVTGADNMPLGSASLRIFQILCQGETCGGPARIPPALRAQTRTDMSGRFSAVLPLP